MLQELHITNFAIIDDIRLEFSDGFNVITGETGAGKSILIDAVNIVLGAQADKDFIRTGSDFAAIEAVFAVPKALQDEIQTLLSMEEIEYETLDEIMLSREIRPNRSVARVNGGVCKLNIYREIGSLLVDIHGQGDHVTLLKPREHIFLLDRAAHLEDARLALGTFVKRLHHIQRDIASLQQNEADLARRVEILEYQVQEIETAALKLGEDDELREESNRLVNSERLIELTHETERLLFTDERTERAGAVELLEEASISLEKLARLDPSMSSLSELADSLSIQVEELADSVRRYSEQIDISPGQLDKVEERLTLISSLKRKYGGSIAGVLEFAKNARQELDNITHSEERLAELQKQEEQLLHRIGDLGADLSAKRKAAAKKLSEQIEKELQQLRMEAARFEVSIEHYEAEDGCYVGDTRLEYDVTGIDHVEFLLATNFGEPLKPLAKVASGGETARSMLALMSVLSEADKTPCLIFDEVDQGIGGRLGSVLGEKLWRLSDNHQVLCVTHLAQIASFADNHFQVAKEVVGQRTLTRVRKLDPAKRLLEIAEMLGSEADSARQNAHDLLNLAWQVKHEQKLKI